MSKAVKHARALNRELTSNPRQALGTSFLLSRLTSARRLQLIVEHLEERCCLSASAALSPLGTPLISQDQAIAIALNDVTEIESGFQVTNRQHVATFTDSGVEVEPTQGGPTWHWQLSSIGTDSQDLIGVDKVHPKKDSPTIIHYDRGLVVEQYVIRKDAIEQQFLIEEPLPIGGEDLVIAGAVESPGDFVATAEGWIWYTPEGVVSLGDVTVLDATGRELDASMTVTAERTQIRIPASELHDAVYPILVDPEVGTNDFRISEMGPGPNRFVARDAAIAYNSTQNHYLVVFVASDTTPSEFEIHGQLINAVNGNQIFQDDFRISDMGQDGNPNSAAQSPSVAYNSRDDQYLVVWSGSDLFGEFEIFGQRLSGLGAEVGANDFAISLTGPIGNPNFDATNPDVAYNSVNNEYFVVWSADTTAGGLVDNEFEIYGQLMTSTGLIIGPDDFRISDMGPDGDPGFSANSPAVAYNSTLNDYVVVWSGTDNVDGLVKNEFEIFRQRIRADGVELGANDFRISDMGPNGNTVAAAIRPDITYNSVNNEYLVVWQGSDNTNNEFEIFGQRLNGTGAPIGTNDFRISAMGEDGDNSFIAGFPSVTYNSVLNEYLVVWEGNDSRPDLAPNEGEIFGQRLSGATAAPVGADDFRISDNGVDGDPSVAARLPVVAFNSTNNEYEVAWQSDFRGAELEIFTQRIDATTGAEVGPNDRRITDVGVSEDFDAQEPAVAFNSINNEFLVVWSGEKTVEAEFDIHGRRINAITGNPIGTDFRISDMGPDGDLRFGATRPAVAHNTTNNQYLVVWQGDDDALALVNNELEIFGQRLTATGTEIGENDFRISDMGPDGDTRFVARNSKVAYNSANNEYLVVWEGDDNVGGLVDNEIEIFGQRINAATGAQVGTNDFRISDMGSDGDIGFFAREPDVTYNSAQNQYLVVWSGRDNVAPLSNGEVEIFGQRLRGANGALVGENDFRISDMGPNGNPVFFAVTPAVAYNPTNNQYLVVWSGQDSVEQGTEIYGQRLSGGGVALGTNDFQISDMGPPGDGRFEAVQPDVAYNVATQRYFVVWRGEDDSGGLVDDEFEIFGQEVPAIQLIRRLSNFRISDMGPDGDINLFANAPAVASSSIANRTLVVWQGRETGGEFGNFDTEIFGQNFEVGDFGDAPNSYLTRQKNGGAWHSLGTDLFLGSRVDGDEDGQPSANAQGDDRVDRDDEDGVKLESLIPGYTSSVRVTASRAGKLDAFVDFNRDGDFGDAGEKIFDSVELQAGVNRLTYEVPVSAIGGDSYARFRLSSSGGLSFAGRAPDGEVEDYLVHIEKVCAGTNGNDVLRLRPIADDAVACNRVSGNQEVTLEIFEPEERVIVLGLNGNDAISVIGNVTRDVVIDGGAGNDQIEGGAGDDLLLGGDGIDLLSAGDGRNVLIGGDGVDTLGRIPSGPIILIPQAENLLIGGRTAFDSRATALLKIIDEWSSAKPFDQRVANLRNGVEEVRLDVQTAIDDGDADSLWGSSGPDWFWQSPLDTLVLHLPGDELN